ncbi:hypothetical protein KAU19_03980, partial [Candidatus Parcubacteria bacterium]|nr:hypothetical protein [Candidatus Parcubacteria bacterium]
FSMEKLKKSIIIGVMVATVLSMSMVVAPQVGATASAGDLIKMDALSSVYYLGADDKRYVFPNEQTFFSWYSDFSAVVTIPQSELESYPLAANVTIRPGTKLVKITTDPKVYAVESNGTLVHVPDEATAIALYGADWAQRVVDVPDAFFTNYTVSAETVSATAYPEGSLIKTADLSTVYYVDASGNARQITTGAAFEANRFKWSDVITTTLAIPTAGTDLAAVESTLIDTSSGAGGTPVDPIVGTGLTVALASDTPAAESIPAGSPTEFLKINLTASSDGAVKINTIKLSAYNLGLATYIDSVTFYDDGIKVGTSKNMNSDRIATFNFSTPIEVAAGTTKALTVKATMLSTITSGNFALGIASASDVTTDGAAVSGSFPIQGNTKAVTDATIGTVTMSSVDTTDTTNNFGEDNVLLAGFNLDVANEAVLWESMRLKNGGTNTAGIAGNMRLLIDGDEIVTGVELVGKYVDFDLANHVIAKNDTITVEIYGDIGIANVDNTVKLYIDDINDLSFIGQSYGYGIQLANTATSFQALDAASDAIIVTLAAGDVTIDMDKSATPSKDVRPGDKDVVLATISILSSGEDATITSIANTGAGTSGDFYIAGTGLEVDEATNFELVDVDTGSVYDITETASSTIYSALGQGWTLSMTDEISLVKGVTKTFQLRCDLGDSTTTAIDADDTLKVTLEDGAFTITGDDSNDDLSNNITPTSVSSAIATVKTASLSWTTTSLANKTIVPGTSDVVIYRAGLEAGESSYITLTSVKISSSTGAIVGAAFDDNNISALRLYLDGKLVKTSAGNIVETGAPSYINFTSLDTVNRVIPAGASVVLEVKADFAGAFNPAGQIRLSINTVLVDIVCKDKDNNDVAESVANLDTVSRVLTLTTKGTLKVELKVDDSKANDDTYILAGTATRADKYLAELVFTTANEAIKIKTLVLEEHGSSTANDIKTVDLYDSTGTLIKSKTPATAGHVNFDALNIVLPADQATSWFIGVTTKTINAQDDPESTCTFGNEIQFSIGSTTALTVFSLAVDKAITAIGNDSGDDIDLVCSDASLGVGEYDNASTTSKLATTTGSILTSVVNDLSDSTLTGGNGKIIGKYKFTFDNGTNRTSANIELKAQLREIVLTIASSTNVSVNNVYAYIEGDSSNKTDGDDLAVITGGHSVTVNLTELDGNTSKVDGVITLVFIGDIITSGANEYLQTEINDLTSDFTYNGNNGDTGMQWNNQASDLGVSEVTGATLSN